MKINKKLPIITLVTKNTANNTMYDAQVTQSLNESFDKIVFKVLIINFIFIKNFSAFFV